MPLKRKLVMRKESKADKIRRKMERRAPPIPIETDRKIGGSIGRTFSMETVDPRMKYQPSKVEVSIEIYVYTHETTEEANDRLWDILYTELEKRIYLEVKSRVDGLSSDVISKMATKIVSDTTALKKPRSTVPKKVNDSQLVGDLDNNDVPF